MANILFEQENACLHPPGLRQRLQSAPGEELLKTPAGAKVFQASFQSGRKALGRVNQVLPLTPSVNTRKLLKLQETKPKVPQNKLENYPDIEKFIPYDPLEFEKYSIPEDLLPLSKLALPGLACVSRLPEESEIIPLPALSPVKILKHPDYCSELDDFLDTLDKLTVELPAETDLYDVL
uniref:Securin n=1 Tax=Neogobius melanostomus TaxID=47308 RepID=A0A8C6SL40_9GOBI